MEENKKNPDVKDCFFLFFYMMVVWQDVTLERGEEQQTTMYRIKALNASQTHTHPKSFTLYI